MIPPLLKGKPLPRHIAIIMDGNGRWAKSRGLPRIFGHRAGTQSVREAVKVCGELGIEALTLYAFSTENWARPKAEVSALMGLLSKMLSTEVSELNKSGVRLMAVGRLHELPAKVRGELEKAIDKLKSNTGLILNLALNYGGRQEIADAVNKIIHLGIKKVDEKILSKYLYTADLPDPDLMIRTSGEMRISNFLLYQLAYAELYVTPTLWPDFRREHLYQAIASFQARERRFGGA
ncbi:MAG: di-trans,poly-cis-decaprenylcistransferase [Elusimicrobia bacterium RIFCSPLOWO2_01_FULL_54_10]|nr:MAG: di-trans,poly-cis-decaprenylcistransferase [Elusimicrobia bacterium RIFCSPLOWO2_01_FULL_54_10]